MENNENINHKSQMRKENLALSVLFCVFAVATAIQPWLLVWIIGLPLMVAAALATIKLTNRVRASLTPVEQSGD